MAAIEVRPGRSGPLALCSDGLAGTWPDWLPLADALPGVRLIAVVRQNPELDDAAAELAAALDTQQADRAVLIGHSMGGFVVEATARLWPERVSGILLLDGSVTPADPLVSALDRLGGQVLSATVARAPALARIAGGVKRAFEPAEVRHDPERRRLVDPLGAQPAQWGVIARELTAYADWAARLEAIRTQHPLPPVPIHVVTAHQGVFRGWVRRQAGFVERLRADPGGPTVHHHIVRSGHLVQLAAPEAVAALAGDLWD
ncbi:alpha/beta hydrolase [Ammonicoccus fulvus]|uniref:Alpha/beta hydrolase n=1 Tax=Ammonicoccus fulvus TaxID=3138240 RepID=A0ABZ3FSI2_9ACTN